jgi:hypothetical protein
LELSQHVEIHHQMVEVCEAHEMAWKQVWIWYNAFNKIRAHADGKQKPIYSWTSTMTDILCCAGTSTTQHRSTKINAVGWELDVLLGSVHSTVHNWTPEKCMHDGHKTCHMETCLLHLKHYAYQGQQFLQNTVTRNERSVMWHQKLKSIYDVETHHFLQERHTKHCYQ